MILDIVLGVALLALVSAASILTINLFILACISAIAALQRLRGGD